MASEVFIAKESGVNPINALRGGTGNSSDSFRNEMKREGWGVRKTSDEGILKATTNLPIEVQGEKRRLLLQVFYDEKTQKIKDIKEVLIHVKGQEDITVEYNSSEIESLRGSNVVETAKKARQKVLGGHSKITESINRKGIANVVKETKRIEARNKSVKAHKRERATSQQRSRKERISSKPQKYVIDYYDKGRDLSHVWVMARSQSEAIQKAKSEFWDIDKVIEAYVRD